MCILSYPKHFRVLGLLREKSELFIPLGIQIELDFPHNNNQAPLIQIVKLLLSSNVKLLTRNPLPMQNSKRD